MDKAYFDLVQELPLISIKSEEQYNAANDMIDKLLRRELNDGEEEYLIALSDLIWIYDYINCKDDVDNITMLKHLMEAREIDQRELSKGTGIAESTISCILSGKREMRRNHITAFSEYFHVSRRVFNG